MNLGVVMPTAFEPVQLRQHSPLWKWKFRKEKLLLGVLLGKNLIDIEHVGSTAIPGMIAKPIIDFLATVPDFERAFQSVSRIERIGYEYKGENLETKQYTFVRGTPL